MTLFQRWKQTALHNKALVLTGVIVALGTLFGTGAAIFQAYMMRENDRETTEQINKLIQAANVQAGAARSFSASAENIKTETYVATEQFRKIVGKNFSPSLPRSK